jgi:DNA-binding beta-propeller fold protein YncE
MWGSEGEGNGQFLQPHGIGIDSKDNLYVTDAELLNVQKFDSNGQFISNGEQGARQTANSVSQQESLLMLQIMYI